MGSSGAALAMRVFSPFVSLPGLRAQFPVLSSVAYLNAGTDGPLPASAVHAAALELERELAGGRAMAHFERRSELAAALRSAYATVLRADSADVALTTCTTEGMAQVVGGLELGSGDEILTSDEEHPGLLGALSAARELRGVDVREVPFADLARSRRRQNSARGLLARRLGERLDGTRRARPARVPVLLDGAQGVGAVPVDVHALGCDAYAGAGQKWLCGPDGDRHAVRQPRAARAPARLQARLRQPRRPQRRTRRGAARGRAALRHALAERRDPRLRARRHRRARVGGLGAGARARPHARRASRRDALRGTAARLPRAAQTTLVSFTSADPEGERALLAERGVIVRNIPDRPWLRASVGAWNDEDDLERLVESLSG